jgi:ubiquinone biosynthesis protein UbiJ
MTSPFPHPATRALNHVLRSAPLAMERLRRHAGRTAAFHVGPVTLAFTVQTNGEVTAALPTATRDLTVRVSPFLLPRLAARDEAAYREIEMQGDMELAHEVSFLARHLAWDVEEDLSKVVGDIAAHRMVSGARDLARWGREATLRASQGAAEYWTEESPLIASRVKVESFLRDVSELRDAVERLDKRVGTVEKGSGSIKS